MIDNNEKCIVYETDLEKYHAIEANLLQAIAIYTKGCSFLVNSDKETIEKALKGMEKISNNFWHKCKTISFFLNVDNI